MSETDLVDLLYQSVGIQPRQLRGQPDVARIEIHANRVLGVHLVPGLQVDAKERKDGIEAEIVVTRGSIIPKPIYVCFGTMPEDGRQQIVLRVEVEPEAKAAVLAHCTFPNARRIRHEMQAVLNIGRNAEYAYLERHVHGPAGGVLVLPRSRVHVDEGARYRTEFELIRGRVGEMAENQRQKRRIGLWLDHGRAVIVTLMGKTFYRIEKRYGRFERVIPLPTGWGSSRVGVMRSEETQRHIAPIVAFLRVELENRHQLDGCDP